MITFEERVKKLSGMQMDTPEFRAAMQKEIEEHLLDQSFTARAVAEVIAHCITKIKWK